MATSSGLAMRGSLGLIAILMSISAVIGHICLMNPHQRGPLDIREPGDDSCFRRKPPCGGQAPANPTINYYGNTLLTVQLQQNFNHYEPGNPGYMDISWSTVPNPTEDNFTTLAVIPDFNAHMQYYQRNFSYTVTVPSPSCSHCVLRTRYVPNKPTETTFYQCADVAVVSQAPSPSLVGIFAFPVDSNTQVNQAPVSVIASIDIRTGSIIKIVDLGEAIRKQLGSSASATVYDQVCTVSGRTLWYIASPSGSVSQPPNTLLSVDLDKQLVHAIQLDSSPWVALNYNVKEQQMMGLQILPVNSKGDLWQFSLWNINTQTGQTQQRLVLPQDDTWVNYQWSTYNIDANVLYLLAGNENDPVNLSTKLYSIDLNKNAYTSVEPDNAKYTIAGIHYDSNDGVLWALSPGLVQLNKTIGYTWYLVQVDPSSGSVTMKYVVAKSAFTNYYGGDIYGWNVDSRILNYIFYVDPEQTQGMIGSINVDNGQVQLSSVIVNLSSVHNLAFV